MIRIVYNTVLFPLKVLLDFWVACLKPDSPSRERWAQRLGHDLPRPPAGGVWLHGASVGEVRIIEVLTCAIRGIAPDLPLYTSARTDAGRTLLPAPPAVDAVFYAPLDFSPGIRRLLDRMRPSLIILAETEIWPNLLHEIHLRGIPVTILNARLSQKRMGRYTRLSSIFRPLLGRMALVGAQSDEDAVRYLQMGVPAEAVAVTGNIKYDLPLPPGDSEALRQRFGLSPARPVIVAGSTGRGEERKLFEAFHTVIRSFPDTLLILAPRHLERVEEVEQLAGAAGLRSIRLTASNDPLPEEAQVLLVDTMGELSGLYRLAWAAFVGGSLVPVGGHNLLEPAALGVPVLFGPHVENFEDPAAVLVRSGGGKCVKDVQELSATLLQLIEDGGFREKMGKQACRILEENRGALEKSLHLLRPFLDRSTPSETEETA